MLKVLQFVKCVLLVCIHYRRNLYRVRYVVPVPLQILEHILGHQRVLLVPLVRIHYLPPLRRVRPVLPLPTLPLFNAPLVPIKKLPRAMQDIMEILVTHRVNHVLPESGVRLLLQRPLNVTRVALVPLQILEQVLGHQRVLVVPLVCIHRRRNLYRV